MGYLFETEHLRARRFEENDAARLYACHLDEEVKKWIPNESYADPEEALDAIRFFAGCVENAELLLGTNGENVKGTLAPLEAVIYEEAG